MGSPRLLSDPAAVDAAFEAACDWCEALSFVTPAAAPTSGIWPVWAALERNASKIAAAFVALDSLRSEPAALEWFQSHDCLRFVPAADGSFRANVFRFQKGDDVRVLVGGGRLAPAGLMAPLDAMLLWEGNALDPFAASVDAAFAKAGQKAHVPTKRELEDYAAVFETGGELWDQLVELAAPFVRATAHDAEIPELELVVDEKIVQEAMGRVRAQLIEVSTEKQSELVGSATFPLYWSAALKLSSLFPDDEGGYKNVFDTSYPDPEVSPRTTVAVNVAYEGASKMAGALAIDPQTGNIYLVHRGLIRGKRNVGSDRFWKRFRGGVHLREPGRDEKVRVAVVGKVGAPEFPRDVAGFVHEVGRIKAGKDLPPQLGRPAPPPSSETLESSCQDLILVVANDPQRVAELAAWAATAAPECDVLVAFDGKRAIAALEQRPRLIITEAFLTKASGLEVIASAREHDFARHAKVLLLAGAMRGAGFQADEVVLEGPVGKAVFLRAVRNILSAD